MNVGMCHGGHEACQIDVGGNDVTLLGEVGRTTYDIVAAVVNLGDEGIGAVVRGPELHDVAHGHGICAAYAPEAEVAFHLARKELAVVRTDVVPAPCVTYDEACHP